MTFLNSALAWGAFAASVPLILHILNRSRFRRVEWGAMHLLESVIRVNHKRFRFEQLLLLLVRCAIPALLAFCLARPALTGSQELEGDAPVSLVVLLDTSYSMDAASEGGSRFDKARDAVCAIVEKTGRGSDIAVIQTGGNPTPLFDQPVFDSAAVVRRVRTASAGYGATDVPAALELGVATLAGMSNARKELIVVSDFQPSDWNAASEISDQIREQLAAITVPTAVTLLPVGTSLAGNVSVDSLEFSQRPLGVGHELSVRANVTNHSRAGVENARVVLSVDGAEHSVSQISIDANGSAQALFRCSFDSAGSHVIEAGIEIDDPLPADNSFQAAVTIWDAIDVVLVDGDPSPQPLGSETDFLSVALTPYTFGRMKLADLVQSRVLKSPSELNADTIDQARVVILANVSRLGDTQTDALAEYVSDGGSLIVCGGNRIDAEWYNRKLFAEKQLLPGRFATPRGMIDDNGQTAHIVVQRFDHPALQLFNDASNGDLSTAEIRRWFELQPAEDAIPMVTLDSGDPLLLERRVKDGTVVQLATACDDDWSDLPMRPFFVPLAQQLVTTLATRLTPPRNIGTGEPAVALFPMDDDSSDATVSVEMPTGVRRTLRTTPEGSLLMARFESTRHPGVYDMTTPEGESIHFVAATSREESDPATLDDAQLASIGESLDATIAGSAEAYLEQDRLRRHGREIWRYVLAALLAFMFLELILQQRFSRVRT